MNVGFTGSASDCRVRAAAASTAVVGRLPSVSAAKDTSHLGAIESTLDVHSWRSHSPVTERYFTAIAGWGYEMSEVESLTVASF